MFGKKKAPSVKIPSSVLKREAQKMAKKMLTAEKKKEKMQEMRAKAKAKAARKVARKKDEQEEWDSFFHRDLEREIYGGLWIGLAIIVSAIFLSSAELSLQITNGFRFLFGAGMWLPTVVSLMIGMILLTKRNVLFPPQRVLAGAIFFVSMLGIMNLFVPQDQSLELSRSYGGAIGFTIGFFPRAFLGDIVAWVMLLSVAWISGVVTFGIHLRTLLSREPAEVISKDGKSKVKIEKPTGVKTETSKSKVEKPTEEKKKSRFKNELEIIQATPEKKPAEEIDPLTEAKNKAIEGVWEPPDIEILKDTVSTISVNEKKLRSQADIIREKFEQFGILVEMKSVHVGPTVTQFTLEPSAGVKLTKITALKNDLALALAAESVRIEAPIRGKSLVGIEIPNEKRAIVGMREIIQSDNWKDAKSSLTLALGRDVAGKPVVANLAKMPHLLIAGKTGSGKSVAMNAFLCSLLWQHSPKNLRMILVDPKRVELSLYNNLPHLLTSVIVEPEKCVSALAWAVAEMNRRYRQFSEHKCRNIEEYNAKFKDAPEPFIVIVIDELADLMMVAGKDVEAAICRIAQMARAVGMHLIIATQRPSVDVVTGLIKANLPARIAFKVSSGIDSRTILDQNGSEDLLGFGDMLMLDGNSGNITRIQGIYISNEEVERITNHIKLQFPEMVANDEITNQSIEGMAKGGVLTAGTEVADDDLDEKFEAAVSLVLETHKASASFLQRRLEVGYARAARILDQMEGRGIIGPARGAKPREVYGTQDNETTR